MNNEKNSLSNPKNREHWKVTVYLLSWRPTKKQIEEKGRKTGKKIGQIKSLSINQAQRTLYI